MYLSSAPASYINRYFQFLFSTIVLASIDLLLSRCASLFQPCTCSSFWLALLLPSICPHFVYIPIAPAFAYTLLIPCVYYNTYLYVLTAPARHICTAIASPCVIKWTKKFRKELCYYAGNLDPYLARTTSLYIQAALCLWLTLPIRDSGYPRRLPTHMPQGWPSNNKNRVISIVRRIDNTTIGKLAYA
ncbi:hypothetical protein F5Y04DRAFT_251999 [Hypomontagnella monticulosa]|nr:hypothetical protein F5Y04DRAFT_251999 [Hypomontagnella monticulosa]